MKLCLLSLFLLALGSNGQDINPESMDALIDLWCEAAGNISAAFWSNGGKFHEQEDAYPEAACEAAYEVAWGALNGAYLYPEPVLFKPTLSDGSGEYAFRPSIEGALSYFIGTDCILASPSAMAAGNVFPPGNTDGTSFREYGFGLANYGKWKNSDAQVRGLYGGFTKCTWTSNSHTFTGNLGVSQGQMCFERAVLDPITFQQSDQQDEQSCVDKTWVFAGQEGNLVLAGHHSSSRVSSCDSNQYEFASSAAGCQVESRVDDGEGGLEPGSDDDSGTTSSNGGDSNGGDGEGDDSPGTGRMLAKTLITAIPAFFLGGIING